ncbi:glycosyltransferase family 9 protein [Pollutimonas thiosulfatoxidans]|uniref:Glycosyl transferase n=1 Tax=Pollutimonas thiosulfatoxidans TaxID=2028345 RepID=A0A410GH76_9BURK|nr:glycosyltransferase family 9 protein [Pollutimonas thiosulfatoxidans]QAA95663.1 glycosyl transferase [Pollutimonas thiosulfatoxidans]
MTTSAMDWSKAQNILCVRLDNMGDVLMTTPAIRAIKTARAQRHLTLMASASGAVLRPHLTEVDDLIVYDAAWVKNDSSGNEADRAIIDTLAARQFDAAVIFTVFSQSALPAALMCHLAGIPRILAHARENPYRLLNPWVRDTEPQSGIRHEVQRQLDLVAAVGMACGNTQLSFQTREADRLALRAILRRHEVDAPGGWIVAHCGATAESRRYGAAGFARALSLLQQQGRTVLLTGTEAERGLIQSIRGRCAPGLAVVDLTGCLSLGQFACLIEDADLLISNNTGPVHIAAAVQTPVVDLYALTNPQHTPWQVAHRLLSHDVPCKYCYRSVCPQGDNACLNGVAPEAVARAACELLEETACTL